MPGGERRRAAEAPEPSTGADALVRTARAAGVEICLANPGTTELGLVTALDRTDGIRPVPCLFEGVASGAADGWARMRGSPAMALLHLGPGLANAGANLHNARRAHAPLLAVVGEHARWHLPADPLLASDIQALAATVCDAVFICPGADEVAGQAAAALEATLRPPGGVAALVVPDDVQRQPTRTPSAPVRPAAAPSPAASRIESVARRLRAGSAVLLLGGAGCLGPGLAQADRVRRHADLRLFCETFPARLERGAGLPALERLPYFPDQALEALAGTRTLVLAGAREPVAFFGYPGLPGRLVPEGCHVEVLARPDEDVGAALGALADAVSGSSRREPAPPPPLQEPAAGALDPVRLGLTLAAAQPEAAIVVDEALTSVGPWFAAAAAAPPHTTLALTGGAIGAGLPLATGAALACPDRPVIAFQADGSGLYTLQALWTQAREGLNVVNLLCANRSYRILRVELARAGVAEPGPAARAFTDLVGPAPDWVQLARGFGVEAARVETAEALAEAMRRALASPGPHLIEALL